MADAAPSPELRYLRELSTEVRAAVLIDPQGRLGSSTDPDPDRGRRLAELTLELFDRAGRACGATPSQIEVATDAGAVFAIREAGVILAAVTGRLALPSLMFYDLRRALASPGSRAA